MNPTFMYGTAWKEEKTATLTLQAIRAGFRAIDTANQRKHYHEVGVGEALQQAYADRLVTREELFLQTKFTSVDGQDHRLPYDQGADPATQVEQSFASSLTHLHTDYLDSYVLHGPTTRHGLADYDWQVWRAMETLHAAGKCRQLGVSNVAIDQLELLCARAQVKPTFVQNRCYAKSGWDRAIRTFCRQHEIVYQGFSLLTGNRAELAKPKIVELAARRQVTVAQLVFGFAGAVGMLPLTGSSSDEHLRQDLVGREMKLTEEEIQTVERIGG